MTKYIKIIFTLSVLLNLVLIGIVGAGSYKKNQWKNSKWQDNPHIKEIMREHIKNNKGDLRKNMQESKVQRDKLKSIISAKEFDRQAYDEQVSKMLSHKSEMAQMKAKAMGDTLSELSYEDRQSFARHVLKNLSDRRKGPRSTHDVRH